ncbi:MAG: L-arabinose isomerase [Spirochaetia bacterium]|jgi:L-arabinose isomerase
MIDLKEREAWFVTGSQSLYGKETLDKVAEHSREIARELSASLAIPVTVVFKPVVTTPEAILEVCREADSAKNCIGLVAWMHTFSPAKMWIAGLTALKKPFAHLHTQYNRDIPWSAIDMDFMNLNQSAHGDREFGFIGTRLRRERAVIVGHWREKDVQDELAVWMRAACAWHDWQTLRVARFGDNMREVAVTEGDKVEAQIRFGYAVNGFGVGDLVSRLKEATDSEIDRMVSDYDAQYEVAKDLRAGGSKRQALKEAARIEVGMRHFLESGGFHAFTTSFEDLHGLAQLPGLAVQRLMAEGYGFGAEGDWKTAALVRAMKVMGSGMKGGTSFMEDYTYHLDPKGQKVLGAHMLEVCPSLADGKPSLEMHPLGIGGKDDPARLVFSAAKGAALNATIIDMGTRFRMVVNEVDVVAPDAPLPKLPVARALWVPRPDLKVAAAAWIHAGGAHHSVFSYAVNARHLEDFADIAGIECLLIDGKTDLTQFRKELRWNAAYWHQASGV